MTLVSRVLALGTAILLAACGSSSGGGIGTPTTGTATFTQAATGTLAVYVLGNHSPQNDYSTLDILSGVFGSTEVSYPNFGFEAQFPGSSLATGTFGTANTNASTTYTNASMVVWGQTNEADLPLGDYSLTLSSVGSPSTVSGNTVWYVAHGMLTATLDPADGNTGSIPVIASVTF